MVSDYFWKLSTCLLVTVFFLSYVSAQEISAIPARLIIPDGTAVELRLVKNISSAHARVGDRLDFVVVKDVSVGGFTVIQAGTMALGSITGVKSRRLLGIGGKISLKLDSVELVNGDRVGLRASKEVKGVSRTKFMVGEMIITSLIFLPAAPVFALTRGRSSTVLKSTEVTARIEGTTPILLAGLQHSRESSFALAEMMDYLPPRVFDGEGREGDMVNMLFVAQQENLQDAFKRAGWVKTDRYKPVFIWHLLRHRSHDTKLPMSRLFLFGRVQDYSYALPDPGGVISRRHHLRIWKTGSTIDETPVWVGAATYDVAIEIATRGHLVNHRIDPEIDAERDFIGVTLADTSSVSRQEYLHPANPVFQAQTASGEAYHSDSRILLLDLQQITQIKVDALGQASTVLRRNAGVPGLH